MGIEFQRGEGLFTDYIKTLYHIKASGKGPRRRVLSEPPAFRPQAKLLMNSLYGRLGMKDIFNQSAIVEDITAISIHHSISMNLKFESGVVCHPRHL